MLFFNDGASLRMNSFLIQEHKYSPCLTVFFFILIFSNRLLRLSLSSSGPCVCECISLPIPSLNGCHNLWLLQIRAIPCAIATIPPMAFLFPTLTKKNLNIRIKFLPRIKVHFFHSFGWIFRYVHANKRAQRETWYLEIYAHNQLLTSIG